MSQARRSIAGTTALVVGAGDGVGRAVALALGARGARVMVAGAEEKAIARVVGEVTCGGGTARHVAGDPSVHALLSAALGRAVEVFGPVGCVVVADRRVPAESLAMVVASHLGGGDARLLLVEDRADGADKAALQAKVEALAEKVAPGRGTCNGLLWTGGPEQDPDALGEVALFLLGPHADGISGETLTVSR